MSLFFVSTSLVISERGIYVNVQNTVNSDFYFGHDSSPANATLPSAVTLEYSHNMVPEETPASGTCC